MTIRTYNFTFDVKRSIMPEPVFIRQNDSTGATLINVHLVDNGVPVKINGDLEFRAMTADSQNVIADTTGFSNIDIDKGAFSYALPNQLSMTPGKIRIAYFMMVDASGNASTLSFVIFVKPSADLTPSGAKNYISIIDGLIKAFNEWNETAQSSWQDFVNANKQIIESIDPGGKVLSELIDFRHSDMLSKTFDTAKLRGDFYDQDLLDRGINVKWYGSKGDGNTHLLSESYTSLDDAKKDYPAATSLADTKDWCAITEAIKEGQNKGRNIYLTPGNYFVNKTVTLPTGVAFYGEYQNSKIYASSQMSEDSKNDPLAILEYDGAGQPPIYVENIQVIGTSDQTNQLIGLHLGGNRASKISNFIVTNCFGHGTLVYPTHPQSADVENTTFEHYWQVQSGSFCIKSNTSIDRGNITDFAVYDSQITTLSVHDENQSNTSSPAVEIINEENKDTSKTVYGIEFTRCFLNAQGNNLVRVVGCHLPRATHSINFDFIKGELRDVHGDLGPGSDKFFLFHLENCRFVMVDHSPQLAYSEASYVEMKRCSFCDIQTAGIIDIGRLNNDSMIFTLDEYSYENHINLIGMDIYLASGSEETIDNPNYGYDFGQAHDAMDLFTKMKDEGSDNHITGWQIGQTLTLNNEPQRLKHITNGKIDGLADYAQNGVTSSLIPNSAHTKHVLAKGTVGPQLSLPIPYKRTSGFLISFRAIGSEDDLKKLQLIAGSNLFKLPTDQNWHVWTGICKTNVLKSIGIQAPNSGILSNDVTLEIEYLDCFMENKIPYYPDFVALPMPTLGEGNY